MVDKIKSVEFKKIGTNNHDITVTLESGATQTKRVKVDATVAKMILEAQERYTNPATGRRKAGGQGIDRNEMFNIMAAIGDSNGRTTIAAGESILIKAMKLAADDRVTVSVNGVQLKLTGAPGTATSGAEKVLFDEYKALRARISTGNLPTAL